jgi:hypothetical protein
MRRSQPRDWTMTVSDHGDLRVLVEVREDGRLRLRRWISADEAACSDVLANIVVDAQRAHWDRTESRR